jgi:hypothetical protein
VTDVVKERSPSHTNLFRKVFFLSGGPAVAVEVAVLLVAGSALGGLWLSRHGGRLHLGSTYPVAGSYEWHLSAWLAAPLAVAAGVLSYGFRLSRALPWRRLLGLSYVGAAVWALALALVAGPAAVAKPLTDHTEYLHDVTRVHGIGAYLRTFTWHIVDTGHGPLWTTHVSGHPPFVTLLFVLLSRVGLPQAGWAAALCVLTGAAAAPAVLSTTRILAGEEQARVAAPFVVAAPVALWIATSADAIFTGVGAAGICALAHAAARHGRYGDVLAASGGLALGGCLFLSYGLVLLAPVAVVAVAVRRRIRPLLVAAIAAGAVVAAFAAAGFWWLDGLHLASRRVIDGPAHQERPWGYFLFANPAAVAIAAGPAVVAALPQVSRLRHVLRTRHDDGGATRPDSSLALAAAALLAMAVATLSDLSRGEVERIYLPWTVWLLPLAAALPVNARRGWLAAQLGWALLIATTTTLSW